jgi:hypothetical protein
MLMWEVGWLGSRTIPPIGHKTCWWGVSAGFQAAQPIHLQGFHAGTGLQDFKLRSVLDIPIAIGHVSVIVIWSAQEQRSRMFGLDVTNLPKPTIERGFL